MIRCTVCGGRVRPPTHPWTITEDGGIHFYRSGTDMKVYAKELLRRAHAKKLLRPSKCIAFVHELCARTTKRSKLPSVFMVALDLEARRQGLAASR